MSCQSAPECDIITGPSPALHPEGSYLPEGPGSVGGPMKCPWYLFHRLFF
ncbi:unnamed protein product [Staurois parvus]|uniref:Uncharacterized protein n=1 Tax=Staurois parvus TaxID=386267 RepID=A0ABN9BKI9_9NEOB|nr:unnamed protein product [Staurois parvus]